MMPKLANLFALLFSVFLIAFLARWVVFGVLLWHKNGQLFGIGMAAVCVLAIIPFFFTARRSWKNLRQ
jgi:hypothetical protein